MKFLKDSFPVTIELVMLPRHTREYIFNKTGKSGLYVRKDTLNTIFGYRKLSLRNFITYIHEDPETNKAFKQTMIKLINAQLGGIKVGENIFKGAVFIEDVLMNLTEIIKDNVVVKSIFVNLINTVSNTWQLWMNGMGLIEALKLQGEAVTNGVRYSQDHAKLRQMHQQRIVTGKLY